METWTEYGVAVETLAGYPVVTRMDNQPSAKRAATNVGGRVVGRQVTASDWLPVDQGGAA